jgi:citronellol/citronellal dehydrogenase
MENLKNKTIFITGSSRGIGRAIALRCAKDGANIVITGKTVEAHPKLPGTITSVAKEVEEHGGNALALQLDVRDADQIDQAVAKAAAHFGGIDILINNASAISLTQTLVTEMKKFDLMFGVNVRATFASSKTCIPFLKKGQNPHILTMSPPLNMDPKWFAQSLAYTMSKYGMSMTTLGLAEELKKVGIGVNSLWPCTLIATAAIEFNFGEELLKGARKPEIVAEAAYHILTQDSKVCTGNFFTDEEVLKKAGITDLEKYAVDPHAKLLPDFYLDD